MQVSILTYSSKSKICARCVQSISFQGEIKSDSIHVAAFPADTWRRNLRSARDVNTLSTGYVNWSLTYTGRRFYSSVDKVLKRYTCGFHGPTALECRCDYTFARFDEKAAFIVSPVGERGVLTLEIRTIENTNEIVFDSVVSSLGQSSSFLI